MPESITTNPSQQLTSEFKLCKFGVMVNSLDMSQKCFYIVKELNKIVDSDCQFSPIVFYKEYAKSADVSRFPMLLEKEVWGYDGVVIATSLATAETLLNCPCPKRKLFYVWNLEWFLNLYNYEYLKNIFNSDLELIARNSSHAKVLEKCWKKPDYIMDNFQAEVLVDIVDSSIGEKV